MPAKKIKLPSHESLVADIAEYITADQNEGEIFHDLIYDNFLSQQAEAIIDGDWNKTILQHPEVYEIVKDNAFFKAWCVLNLKPKKGRK